MRYLLCVKIIKGGKVIVKITDKVKRYEKN